MNRHEALRSPTFAATVAPLAALFAAACGGEPAPRPKTPEPVAEATAAAPPEAPAEATPPPSSSPPPPPPARPSLEDLVASTLDGITEAFNAHDAAKLSSHYADDAVVSAFGAPEVHGRGDVERAMAGLFAAFGDAKSGRLRAWEAGHVVVLETAWAGMMTGDFMGQKATAKPVGQIRASVLTFDDEGLVKSVHEYGDDAGLLLQMSGKKGAPPVPLVPSNVPEIHFASVDDEKAAATAKALDEALGQDDAKAVLASVADDAEYWTGIGGKPAARGKREVGRELQDWLKAFPDQKWIATASWGIDGFGIVESTMTGTQKGRLGALAASGKPVTAWHWLTIVQPGADGKVRRVWSHANLAEATQQIGVPVVAPPPRAPRAAKPAATAKK